MNCTVTFELIICNQYTGECTPMYHTVYDYLKVPCPSKQINDKATKTEPIIVSLPGGIHGTIGDQYTEHWVNGDTRKIGLCLLHIQADKLRETFRKCVTDTICLRTPNQRITDKVIFWLGARGWTTYPSDPILFNINPMIHVVIDGKEKQYETDPTKLDDYASLETFIQKSPNAVHSETVIWVKKVGYSVNSINIMIDTAGNVREVATQFSTV